MADAVQAHHGELGQVAEPLHRRAPGAPLESGRERLAQQFGPGGGRQVGHRVEQGPRAGPPADEQRTAFARAQCGCRPPRPPTGRVRCRGRDGCPLLLGVRRPRPRRTRRRPPAGSGWPPTPAGRRPRPARRGRRRRGRRSSPWCGRRWTRCAPPSRCRTAAGRRSDGGTRAWSPTMLSSGLWARRALWRLARPFPRPGPRWSRVAAGRPAMRPYPSAAPVATPSNRASTPCISGTSSSAATKCISEVPGFMKQVSTPWPTRVRMRDWAPFTDGLLPVGSGCGFRGGGEDLARVEDAVRDRRPP